MYAKAIISILLITLISVTNARLLPDIYWDTRNALFQTAQGLANEALLDVQIRDRINIHCPLYDPMTRVTNPEYSKIYMVSAEGYNNCELRKEHLVLECETPFEQSYITMVFREYTPKPNALEFTPGETYYFISTSAGYRDGIDFRQGGMCATSSMRLKVKVAPKRYYGWEKNSVKEFPTTTSTTPPPASTVDDNGIHAHRRSKAFAKDLVHSFFQQTNPGQSAHPMPRPQPHTSIHRDQPLNIDANAQNRRNLGVLSKERHNFDHHGSIEEIDNLDHTGNFGDLPQKGGFNLVDPSGKALSLSHANLKRLFDQRPNAEIVIYQLKERSKPEPDMPTYKEGRDYVIGYSNLHPYSEYTSSSSSPAASFHPSICISIFIILLLTLLHL